MLRIQFEQTGGPEVLQAVDAPIPDPGPGQVRVRQAAIGLNFIETYQRTGANPMPLPGCPGSEGAGVVDAVGEGVTSHKVGDRVGYAAGAPVGAYAEYYVLPAWKAVKLPDSIGFNTAAAIMLKGMTAEMLLMRVFHVKPGHTILVHAAAGGMGTILSQWATSLGARVIGTVGSQEKVAAAKANGCAEVIIHGEEDIAARVRNITDGKGVPVVYDGIGAATLEASLDSLGMRGMLASFGNASGPAGNVSVQRLKFGSLFLTRPGVFDYTATPDELNASAATVFDAVARGHFRVQVNQTFALKDAGAAHEALEGRRTTGSSLLIP
jgi:NADPH2:quinone reductase